MKGSHVPNEVRAEIREKFQNGSSVCDLVETYELHRATIHRIVAERQRRGHACGRPKIIFRRERQRILSYFQSHPLACCPEVVRALNLSISLRTVQWILSENNFWHNCIIRAKILSEAAREKRLEFARSHVNWSQHTWDLVIFTDKEKIDLVGNDSDSDILAWTEGGQRHTIKNPNYSRKGLMVWGAISAGGTLELICMEENITAQVYVEMLARDFFSKWEDDLPEGFIWMQDNVPPHAAVHTKTYLENKEIRVLDWPPHSPDLNPIENVWGIMSQSMYHQGKSYTNTGDLWEAIKDAWQKIDAQTIRNLYNSMTR